MQMTCWLCCYAVWDDYGEPMNILHMENFFLHLTGLDRKFYPQNRFYNQELDVHSIVYILNLGIIGCYWKAGKHKTKSDMLLACLQNDKLIIKAKNAIPNVHSFLYAFRISFLGCLRLTDIASWRQFSPHFLH